jgi:hypothetical protein
MVEIIACPQCGAPAELTRRFWLDSTDSPIRHLQTICVSKHWLTPGPRRSISSGPPPDHSFATGPSCPAPAPPAVRASTAADRTAGGLRDVPALWGPRSTVLELALGPGRTRRLWSAT